VNQSRGEAARFNSIFREYLRAPEVTRQRIYLETMNDVLPRVGRKLITDKEATGILPLFQFSKEAKEK
jgi:membrane protease subunit HflK